MANPRSTIPPQVSRRVPYCAHCCMYNDANLPISEGATVVDFSNDKALVMVTKHLQDAGLYSCNPFSTVKAELERSDLILAKKLQRQSPSQSAVIEIILAFKLGAI